MASGVGGMKWFIIMGEATGLCLNGSRLLCSWDHRLQSLQITFLTAKEEGPLGLSFGASLEGQSGQWPEPQGFPSA